MYNVLITIGFAISVFYFLKYFNDYNKLKENFEDNLRKSKRMKDDFTSFKSRMGYLKKYEQVDDASIEAKKILNEAKEKTKKANEAADKLLRDAVESSRKMNEASENRASKIAGDAWDAKKNADLYVATEKAMKNAIKGYGNEYLIPNESAIDEMALEYDHKEAGQELTRIRLQIKSMLKHDSAADCDYSERNRRLTAIDFVLDAFNGKVDSIMSKVKYDNYGKLLQQLDDALKIVNYNGKAFRNARILDVYFDLVKKQLKMAVAVQELKRIDMEEQREIKQAMRDEEKARREFDKAKKDVEKQEKILHAEMKEAEAKLALASANDDKEKYKALLEKLNEKLREAEEKGRRAMSMAQQTKQGHVYVISNIGSFGEHVFKIGLTRRLEPLDRVKELGDASVPFSFDVHALIFSKDAPKLEYDLHKVFKKFQVNKVNPRKEFFKLPLSTIKGVLDKAGANVHWTMKAEAVEYRESININMKEKNALTGENQKN